MVCPLAAFEFQSKRKVLRLCCVLRQPNLLRPCREGCDVLTHLTARLRVVPTHFALQHCGGCGSRVPGRLPAVELQSGAPFEHVVERGCHFETHSVGNLCLDRWVSIDDRLCQLGLVL